MRNERNNRRRNNDEYGSAEQPQCSLEDWPVAHPTHTIRPAVLHPDARSVPRGDSLELGFWNTCRANRISPEPTDRDNAGVALDVPLDLMPRARAKHEHAHDDEREHGDSSADPREQFAHDGNNSVGGRRGGIHALIVAAMSGQPMPGPQTRTEKSKKAPGGAGTFLWSHLSESN